jgi:plasmid replication initiation protein
MGQNVTAMGYELKEPNRELKKHAAAIHCSNSLSLLQRKISNALLYHAYKELLVKEEHHITVKQLCRLIGYAGNNHTAIKEAFKELISTVIEWNLIDDKTGLENWTASSIIASVSLEGPSCYYAYSPRMKQLLHSPSMFGKIDLVIQSRFRSSYGLALYENCIRYRDLPHTKWFDMEMFKKLMGVPIGQYEVFRDLKRRVLDKAVDEVNTYSDLFIETEYMREGRKVVKMRFKLKVRAKKTRLGNKTYEEGQAAANNETVNKKLEQIFLLSKEQINQLLSTHDIKYINEKICMIESSKPFQDGKIQNRAAYLLSALKNNYQQASKEHQLIDLETAQQELELSKLKRDVEEVKQDYLRYREQAIHQAIELLPATEKEKLIAAFFLFAKPTIQTILHLQHGTYSQETILDSPQIKAMLRQFAVRELDSMSLLSLEEFVSGLEEQKREIWQKLKSYDPDHALLQHKE